MLTFVASDPSSIRPQAYQRQAYSSQGTHVHVNRTMSQTQTRTDSIDGQDHDEVQKKAKSRRPASKLSTSPPPRLPKTLGPSFVQFLTKALRLYRYCLPAAATESMAVSGPRPSPPATLPCCGLPTERPAQTHPYTQDGFAYLLHSWNHLCSDRRAATLC